MFPRACRVRTFVKLDRVFLNLVEREFRAARSPSLLFVPLDFPLKFSLEFPLESHFNHYGFIDEKKLNTASFTLKWRPFRARWKIRLTSVVPKVLRSSCFFLVEYNVASVL